jgi:hydrogenase expression/formation protein HypE
MKKNSRPVVLKTGKLPPALLARLLAENPISDRRVRVGPKVGEDAAALKFGAGLLVAASDPVTFASDLIGWYAVQVNANDIAAMGAVPQWFLCTVLFPENTSSRLVEKIFRQIIDACRELNISLIGGHAEITPGIDRPLAAGTMLGEAPAKSLVTSSGARPGDDIILAGEIAVEGTALLAREYGAILLRAGVSPAALKTAKNLLFNPGLSIVPAAGLAAKTARVHAMHDPTEGGLAGGLFELAKAAGVGLTVEETAIPVLPLCRDFCRRLELDPLGLIASGALLLTASPKASRRIVAALQDAGLPARVIGKITPPEAGLRLLQGGKSRKLPYFFRDEIARLGDKLKARSGL